MSHLFVALLLSWCLQTIRAQSDNELVAWTVMSKSATLYDPGVYGQKGIPSSSSTPGVRYGAVGGYDNLRKEYWLFGGHGSDSVGDIGTCVTQSQPTHLLCLQI